MTVDVMETAWQQNGINCFVLVTGDSDFSPVFRRLREMGKEVIGVGQHSTLSECVQSSCTRFIFTDDFIDQQVKDVGAQVKSQANSEVTLELTIDKLSDVQNLVKQIIKENQPINISLLHQRIKTQMQNFDFKKLGYKKFNAFLTEIAGVAVNKSGTADFASLVVAQAPTVTDNLVEQYKKLLNKHNYRLLTADYFRLIYKQAVTLDGVYPTLALLKEAVLEKFIALESDITKTDINKAFTLYVKMDLVKMGINTDKIPIIKVTKLANKELVHQFDLNLIAKLVLTDAYYSYY